ncbi:MAG TPA: hypothetical protein VF307_01870 [Candidatus Nanopelagicaceae bacterium]
MKKIKWVEVPEDQDYTGALSYLSLLCDLSTAKKLITRFKSAPMIEVKAKDVIRAAGLTLQDRGNYHVDRDLKKIENSIPLSPILLVRGNGSKAIPLVIADGYHRVCAVHAHSEDSDIKAKIIDWA